MNSGRCQHENPSEGEYRETFEQAFDLRHEFRHSNAPSGAAGEHRGETP